MIDKNLFLHDLAVVAIMKNEGHYLKEWLDYHLIAGVEHFYLYDNESTDNQAEVVKPYVVAGLVDCFPMPGKAMQYVAYNEAVKQFKFQSRYMAFIDLDEFLYPKAAQSVVEVVDAILARYPNASGLAIHWQIFGSNGQDKADYSRGVLERFTRRAKSNWIRWEAPRGNQVIKTIANPRTVNFIPSPHYPTYFEGLHSINENGGIVESWSNAPITVDNIVVNHYFTKSHEEFIGKISRGRSANLNKRSEQEFYSHDKNDEFDDGILRYRAERAKVYQPPDKSHALERLLHALMKSLSPIISQASQPNFYKDKLETFLTCRAVAAYLKTNLTNAKNLTFFEETSLKAIHRTLASGGITFADARLLLRELPNLLTLPYPVVNEIRLDALNLIPQMKDVLRLSNMWKDYAELDYIQSLLQAWKPQ